MKPKTRTVYKLAEGGRVPGVTTILGVLNKPALIKWANNLGLQGIDSTKFVDNLADVGTLAHHMILSYFRGKEPDLYEYSESQIELARNSFNSFLAWAVNHEIEPVLIEESLVSELHRFGGTPDLLATVDGVSTLLDFKTGKSIYPEHSIQVAAYQILLGGHDFIIDNALILRIGRDAGEGFEVKQVKSLPNNKALFFHCLEIYTLQKELTKENK